MLLAITTINLPMNFRYILGASYVTIAFKTVEQPISRKLKFVNVLRSANQPLFTVTAREGHNHPHFSDWPLLWTFTSPCEDVEGVWRSSLQGPLLHGYGATTDCVTKNKFKIQKTTRTIYSRSKLDYSLLLIVASTQICQQL